MFNPLSANNGDNVHGGTEAVTLPVIVSELIMLLIANKLAVHRQGKLVPSCIILHPCISAFVTCVGRDFTLARYLLMIQVLRTERGISSHSNSRADRAVPRIAPVTSVRDEHWTESNLFSKEGEAE